MKTAVRYGIAIAILLGDLMIFVVPVTAIFAAYVLISRPAWFKEWTDRLYHEGA